LSNEIRSVSVDNGFGMSKSAIIRKLEAKQIETATSDEELSAANAVRMDLDKVGERRMESESHDRKRAPLDWAAAQHALAQALYDRAQIEHDRNLASAEQKWREVIAICHEILKERTREGAPSDWALTKTLLGEALISLAAWTRDNRSHAVAKKLLIEAVSEIQEALTERHPTAFPSWERPQLSLIRALNLLGKFHGVREAFRDGMSAYAALYNSFRNYLAGDGKTSNSSRPGHSQLESSPIQATVASGIVGGIEVVQDKRIITRNGVRFVPLSLAAREAQTSESAIRKWIANRIKFDGRLIETHKSITQDLYVSEDFVEKMENRFVKWPSRKPARNVTLGETDDQSGYLSLPDAARILHIGHHTIWLWVTQDKAPAGNSLDVIKCTVSDYFYISEKSITELKGNIPRSGLRRGPRSRQVAQPQT
jgi:hypothetical protein